MSLPVPSSRLRSCTALAGTLLLIAAGVQGAGPTAQAARRSDFTWVRTLSEGDNVTLGAERAEAVAFDGEGNVLAAGSTEVPEGPLNASLFTVAKWNPRGVLQWSRSLSDASATRSEALSVAAAADGSVVAGGHQVEGEDNQHLTVAKWSADGELQWVKQFDRSTTSPEQARLVAFDPAGDVVVVGSSFTDETVWDVAIYKLRAADGEVIWSKHIDGTERSYDMPHALAVDAEGDLFIGGEIGNATESACAVMKVRGSDGERLWTGSLDRPNAFGGGEHVASIALTSNGDVAACGTAYGGETNSDFMIGRFDGATGEREWQAFVHSPVDIGADEGLSVAVDSRDDVLAAGNAGEIAGNHALLVKFSGANGLEMWRRRLPLPTVERDLSTTAAIALTVDDRDHAFLACQRFGITDFFDTVVGEWDRNGRFVGQRRLPEPRATSEELVSTVAVDRRGNLAVGGEIDSDFAVAYLASKRIERVVVRPARLTFGRVEVGDEQIRSFLVRNIGTAPLEGELTSEDPQFGLVDLKGPVEAQRVHVPARGWVRVSVRFSPSDAGRRSANLTLTSTDPRRPTVRIPVSGTGKPSSAP